jgi:aspartate/methionine/tyrosine aminotransferase/phosphoenolpyruvate carboxylase
MDAHVSSASGNLSTTVSKRSSPKILDIAASRRTISNRSLSTPEPLVRVFARRVQQEGALDLTQGDYKNADFAPHPEVVRGAQRLSRNSVHSYGPSVGRMEVRAAIAEFVNRDGQIDYPGSGVRFLPDEVLFTAGTRSGLAMVLEVLGADGSGVVVPRPSWEYDWFVTRAGKRVVELPTEPPGFEPDPEQLDVLLSRGGVSSVILNNPHNPTGRVYSRDLVEALVRVAVKHRVFVLYDSVYQRLDYNADFVNPAFADPEWRDWVVTLSGLSKMDLFGASTGARACWVVLSDGIRSGHLRARDLLANLSAWLVANPSTLSQDWALAALESPLAALRRPSPSMRERRDFMARAADELSSLGVERSDYGGTFYAPLAFPGLVGESFERLRNGVRERATVRDSEDAFELLLGSGMGGIPFAAFAGTDKRRYGTWQRLSYGSKDVEELAMFMELLRAALLRQSRNGSSPPSTAERPIEDEVWSSSCKASGYEALDALEPGVFRAARKDFPDLAPADEVRLTGTKHPDSTRHRVEQLAHALRTSGDGPDRTARVLSHLEVNPLVEARQEFDESIADLLGPCTEVLIDFEGRHISPEWLELPEKVVLALMRHGVLAGEDRHLLVRVPNPWLEPDEEKISKILAAVARANFIFHLACERVGHVPRQNAIYELTVPQICARGDVDAMCKVASLYSEAVEGLFHGIRERVDDFLSARIAGARRAQLIERVQRIRLVPLVENVGALARLPDLLESFYGTLQDASGSPGRSSRAGFVTRFDSREAIVRVFVALSDTAEQSGKMATDAAIAMALAARAEAERRLAALGDGDPGPRVTYLMGAGRAGFRGGLDPAHDAVIHQYAHADGVCMQGIRADAPGEAERLASKFRAVWSAGTTQPGLVPGDRESLWKLMQSGVQAHTETLLRIAPLIAPFGGLVPQTRVRIRKTGSASYGRSIPEYPEEWVDGAEFPDERALRDAWPEGVSLPRAITMNLACTSLGLPPVTSDLAALDKRAALLLARHAPGYREIIASELPFFVRESVALVFGRRFADPLSRRCARAAAALGVDVRVREELIAPTCRFAMLYMRYLADDSDSWDETKEHETLATREEELTRHTRNAAFTTVCGKRPGQRWDVLQPLVDAEDASRLLLARELTIEEKREFVDLMIEGWLRTLKDPLARELRHEWATLRTLGPDELALRAIQEMVALEELRGSRGA